MSKILFVLICVCLIISCGESVEKRIIININGEETEIICDSYYIDKEVEWGKANYEIRVYKNGNIVFSGYSSVSIFIETIPEE